MKKKLSFRHRLVCAIPYSLLHFLISENCLSQFINNACDINAEGLDNSFLENLENKKISESYIISTAFIWDKTLEKHNFWYRRDMWYDTYLKENNIQ